MDVPAGASFWDAHWIWSGAPAGDVRLGLTGTPPEELWDRSCFLRRSFVVAAVPDAAPARVTADARFVLFVNGTEVARGPARSVPERLTWVDVDLAPYLRPGRNVLAAFAHCYGRPMPWWVPAPPSLHLGYGSFAFECKAVGVRSDHTWRALPAPLRHGGRGNFLHPPAEILDGRGVPTGWTGAGFDDEGWSHAVELSALVPSAGHGSVLAEPYTAMEPAGIAAPTALPVDVATMTARHVRDVQADDPSSAYTTDNPDEGDDAVRMAVYDAGRITLATPWVDVWGRPGAVVDVYAAEDLRDDGMLERKPRHYAHRYVVAGEGPTEHSEAFDPVGFRYLAVVTRGEVDVLSVGATERRYPRSGEAFFSCSDERLNRIWDVGARTLDVCSLDAFVDCPGREQRAWVGDSYVHALLTYVTNADWRLVRRHLRLCAQSQRRDGLLPMVVGGDAALGALTIPDYSLHWIRAVARYWEHSGDAATVAELLPVARSVANAFERYRGPSGLLECVPGWVFVDWAQTERAAITGAVDALHAAALADLASLVGAVEGDDRLADVYRRRCDHTRQSFEALWDESRGVYVDAADMVAGAPLRRRRVSQQTNAAAILGGCAPPHRWSRILDRVLDPERLVVTATPADEPRSIPWVLQRDDPRARGATGDFDPEEQVVAAQPFFSHFVHQAVVAGGYGELVPSLCLRWWDQIARGNTTFEEYWDARPGTASRAHAWSATPTYDLTTHVLGVRPVEPGYRRAQIYPMLGALTHVRGTVPTPLGALTVEARVDGGFVDVPPGMVVDIGGVEHGEGRHEIRSWRHQEAKR